MHSVELRTLGELNIRHNNVPVQFLTLDARVLFTYLALHSGSEFAPQVLADSLFASAECPLTRLREAQENLWEAFPLAIRMFRGLSVKEANELGAAIRLTSQPPVISLAVDALDLVDALETDWVGLDKPEAAALLTEAAVAIGKGMAPGVTGAWIDDWQESLCGLYRDATVRFLVADPALCLKTRSERLFSGGSPKSNAPASPPFFGRTTELENLRELLSQGERVISLIGLGGAGKTRLALELLSSLPGEFQHWQQATVSLSGVSTRGALLEALRKGLGQQMGDVLQDGRDPLGSICRTLQEPTVLFLDNAEDAVRNSQDGEVVQTLGYLVYRCPQVILLSTSRCRIGLPEEYVFPVEGLPFPSEDEQADQSLEDLEARYPGLRMLTSSLQSIGGKNLDATQTNTLVALLRQSGGLPLSIELLATRISKHGAVLPSAEQIKSSAGSPRIAIDWALEPLSSATRWFLYHLSIFDGAFTVEDAQAITEEAETRYRLTELDDAGLITLVRSDLLDSQSYRLSPAVLGHARNVLESSIDFPQIQEKYTNYFTQLSADGQIGLRGVDRVFWLPRLRQAKTDILNVIRFKLSKDDSIEDAIRVFSTFIHYFNSDSRPHEGISLAKQVIGRVRQACNVPPKLHAEVVDALGRLQTGAGFYAEGEANLKSVYPFWQEENDLRTIARCANNIAVCCNEQGRFHEAKPYFDIAWRGFFDLNERRAMAQILQNMAFSMKKHGLWIDARDLLSDACEIITTEFPRESLTAKFLFDYAEVLYVLNEYSKAEAVLKDALDILEIGVDTLRIANSIALLGLVLGRTGAPESLDPSLLILCGWSVSQSITDKSDFVNLIRAEINDFIATMRLKEIPVFSQNDLEIILRRVLTL